MKKLLLSIIAVFSVCFAYAQTEYVTTKTAVPSHPRLLLLKGEEKTLLKKINKDQYWKSIHEDVIRQADSLLSVPVQEKRLVGRRMAVQSEDLRRMYFLGYAYRMTGQKKYAARAEQEMLCGAAFDTWNPSHFLDVAEMTMAMAVGYDWCYNYLSAASREKIRTAIIEKGLKASLNEKDAWFLNADHNWNQVCNAGMLYGALSVLEDDKDFCTQIINRSLNTLPKSMAAYAPEGAYPEGPGYWVYGTTFNVFFIAALEKAYKTDFGLCDTKGFLQTGTYSQSLITPSFYQFNYSDNGARASFNPAVFWFYSKTKDPALLYYQKYLYETNTGKSYLKDRTLLLSLIFGAGADVSLANPKEPETLMYAKQGKTPVAVMRSGWAQGNVFLGFKMGSPSVNHAHMDVGSFIFEAEGIRWAIDFGSDNYNRLETRGVDLWNTTQSSQRWDVFRYRTQSHNTLCFNDKPQIVKGIANLDDFGDKNGVMYAMSDLSDVYKDQIPGVKRTVSLVDKKYAVIQDELITNGQFTKVRWNMLTEADKITFVDDKTALLEKDGKKLYMKVEAPFPIRFYNQPSTPTNTYDSSNKDNQFVGFEADLQLNTSQQINVYLMPKEIIK